MKYGRITILLALTALLVTTTALGDGRHFFYPETWSVADVRGSSATAPEPTACNTSSCPPAVIQHCGNPHGWTAVSRMPPVRIVVYDPISNSFGYISPCVGLPDFKDADMRDRYRLVLTTQKIRLLVMPYNPADGDLTLEVKPGQGSEFVLVPSASTSKASATETKPPAKDDKKVEPIPPPPLITENVKDRLKQKAKAADKNKPNDGIDQGAIQATLESVRASGNADLLVEQTFRATPSWVDEFAKLDAAINDYRNSVPKVRAAIAADVETPQDRLENATKGAIALAMIQINSGCDKWTDNATQEDTATCHPFKLASDQPFDAAINEADRRTRFFTAAARKVNDLIDGGIDNKNSISGIRAAFDGVSTEVSQNAVILQAIDDLFARTDALGSSDKDWKTERDVYKNTIKNLHDVQLSLEKRIEDDGKAVKGLRAQMRADLAPISGASTQIQRFDYPPLHDGESVTFAIHRAPAKDGVEREPGHANVIELRSTSADLFRLGMGLIRSGIRNSTFKFGPQVAVTKDGVPVGLPPNDTPALGTDGKPIMMKQLLFDDEGNGTVIPGAFIHNNWGRRSPFLTPTMQERLIPTISLGIPLAKTESLFDQMLLGLNWELAPGVDFNAGLHFAHVIHLQQGYTVGKYVPVAIDTTNVQKKQFRNGVYFGVVLNSEIFKLFQTNGTK